MGPLIAVLAGVVLDKMKKAEAQRQAQQDMRMQFARSISPDVPTWGYQAQRMNNQLDQGMGQSVAALLPAVLGAFGSEEPKPGPSLAQDPRINRAFDISEDMQRRRAMRGFNNMPGFDNW